MNPHPGFIAAAVVTGFLLGPVEVEAQPAGGAAFAPGAGIRPVAVVRTGSLEGVVRDDRGEPVSGAAVSAIGPANKVAIAGGDGRFRVGALPPGPYVIRAHLVGYTPSRRQVAEVRPSTRTTIAVAMHRADSARILAAGLVPEPASPDPEPKTAGTRAAADDDPSELVWRLRHLQRSVLKDRTDWLALGAPDDPEAASDTSFLPGGFGTLARALGSSARFASTLFGDLDLGGEVNLLTTGSFGRPGDLLGGDSLQRAVAYMSLQGTAGRQGAWSVQGIITQGDVGSWVLAGTYRARGQQRHLFDVGASYSAQRYLAGTGSLAAPASEGMRSAGLIHAYDRWMLTPRVTLKYGGQYARYSYLGGRGLFSPTLSVTVVPGIHNRIFATVSRRVLAPGAEEFMTSLAAGLWVPPARTFERFEPYGRDENQRTLHYEVAFEHDLTERHIVAVRGFYQRVTDQPAALFGVPGGLPAVSSHYSVARTGDVLARGWSLGLSNLLATRTRGTITYAFTTADWSDLSASGRLLAIVPSVLRPSRERFHDLTTSVETELPAVETRLVVFYRLNTAFSRELTSGAGTLPGLDGRFDIQVTQPLRFLDFTAADWQVLVAIRNLFREGAAFESVYDELLVVAPPKRVVGGVLVRF